MRMLLSYFPEKEEAATDSGKALYSERNKCMTKLLGIFNSFDQIVLGLNERVNCLAAVTKLINVRRWKV